MKVLLKSTGEWREKSCRGEKHYCTQKTDVFIVKNIFSLYFLNIEFVLTVAIIFHFFTLGSMVKLKNSYKYEVALAMKKQSLFQVIQKLFCWAEKYSSSLTNILSFLLIYWMGIYIFCLTVSNLDFQSKEQTKHSDEEPELEQCLIGCKV